MSAGSESAPAPGRLVGADDCDDGLAVAAPGRVECRGNLGQRTRRPEQRAQPAVAKSALDGTETRSVRLDDEEDGACVLGLNAWWFGDGNKCATGTYQGR